MGAEYSSLKMVRWYAKEGKLPDAPKQVQLILSDLCNQDCHFCAYRMSGYSSNELFIGDSKLAKFGHNNPVRFMPTDRAIRLLGELKDAGVLAVQYTGGGEPTIHANHEAIFREGLGHGLSSALVSNGVKWSHVLTSEILPRFAWVRVSIDSGTAETYGKIRRCAPDHWDKALAHTTSLAGWIKATGSSCLLGVGWVVIPENYHEILDGVRVASETGAAYVRMSAMFNPEHEKPYLEIYGGIKRDIEEAKKRYETSTFTVHDLFGERIEDLRQGRPDYRTCSYQHYTSYIGADLRPYRCCVLAYNHRGIIASGSLVTDSFADFWASEARRKDFATFDARGCDLCQFNSRNKPMSYILEPTVSHEEFP